MYPRMNYSILHTWLVMHIQLRVSRVCKNMMQSCPPVGWARRSGRVTILPDFVGSGQHFGFLSAIANLINVSPGRVGSKKSDPWTTLIILIWCVSSVLKTYLNYERKTSNQQTEHFTHCDQSHANDFRLCVTNLHCNYYRSIIIQCLFSAGTDRNGAPELFLDKISRCNRVFLKRNAPERRSC